VIALLRWLLLRRLARQPRGTLLVVLGVALGVAMVVAIRLASDSAMASFGDTVDAVAGRSNLCVSAVADGFDERLLRVIRRTPGIEAAAPVVEVNTLVGRLAPGDPDRGMELGTRRGFDETLLVLGLDAFSEAPFGRLAFSGPGRASANARSAAPPALDARAAFALLTQPNAVAITSAFAEHHGVRAGDTLTALASGAPVRLDVVAVLAGDGLEQAMGGNVAVADIATVQELFGRTGRLDRVDLIVSPAARDRVSAALAAALPADARPERPQARTRQVEAMVSAFGLNLTALSFISMFVGMFLVLNAVALSVVRQRRDIGVLRALGLTRAGVVAVFVLEGCLLGALGAAAGCALGVLVANVTLHQVGRTLSALYLVEQVSRLHVSLRTLAVGMTLGLGSAVLSALGPALEAAATPAGVTLREGARVEERHPPYGRLALAGGAVLLAAGATTVASLWVRWPGGGFVAAFLIVTAFSLLAPAWTLAVERLASRVARRFGIAATLGARALRENAARASVVVAALTVAVGLLVSLTVMVRSFRRTVDTWVTQTLRGDLYVEPVGHHASQRATALPPELVAAARRLPGVAAVDTYRASALTLSGRRAQVVGIELDVQRRFGRLRFVGGEAARSVLGRALTEGGVVVTESFAQHFGKRPGDLLALPCRQGLIPLRIEGVFYDYSVDAGAVLMDRARYAQLFDDDRTESLALYLEPGASVSATRAAFLRLAGPGRLLYVTPNAELRRRVLAVFDETFRITWALQAIALMVSVLGVVSTLTALVLQRGHELAMLRATGASRGQVRTLVLVESGLLGAAGAALGAVAGLVLALLLVHVINRQFFGWTIQLTLEPSVFVQAMLLMTAAATLAGLLPARLAVHRATAAALRTE
jgi:putative ABC transport system permease protein